MFLLPSHRLSAGNPSLQFQEPRFESKDLLFVRSLFADPELSLNVVPLNKGLQVLCFGLVSLQERQSVASSFQLCNAGLRSNGLGLESFQMRLFALPKSLLSGSILEGSFLRSLSGPSALGLNVFISRVIVELVFGLRVSILGRWRGGKTFPR